MAVSKDVGWVEEKEKQMDSDQDWMMVVLKVSEQAVMMVVYQAYRLDYYSDEKMGWLKVGKTVGLSALYNRCLRVAKMVVESVLKRDSSKVVGMVCFEVF